MRWLNKRRYMYRKNKLPMKCLVPVICKSGEREQLSLNVTAYQKSIRLWAVAIFQPCVNFLIAEMVWLMDILFHRKQMVEKISDVQSPAS